MARVHIDLPKEFLFTTQLKVRVTDLNYGGHVGNDNILSIAHEARLQYIIGLGFKNEVELGDNIGIVVADAAIIYKAESFYGDELEISIGIADINKYGFDMYYRIVNTITNQEVARLKTGIICMNYESRKIATMPETLKKQLMNTGN